MTKKAKTIILLVVFVPLALSLLSKSPPKKTEAKNTITVTKPPTLTVTPVPTTAPTQTITPTYNPTPTHTPVPTEKKQDIKLLTVVKVVDGDTIDVNIDGTSQRLRLIGVDTPETKDPRKPVQCFGVEASNFTRNTLLGKTIYLENDPTQGDKDKYNRVLRYVFLENGENFNKLLISSGYAHEYTYNTPYKYQTDFKEAERQAREAKRGLWSDTACAGGVSQEAPEAPKVQNNNSNVPNGQYTCDCTKGCTAMSTCEEAKYQLNQCGCTKRDSDGDGIPCESLCK